MSNIEEYFNQGLACLQNGDFSNGIEALNNALKIDPNLPVVYLYRGMAYEQINNIDKAITDYDQSLKLFPDEWKYLGYYFRGMAYMTKKTHKNALNDLTNAIKLAPANPDPMFDLKLAYYSRGFQYKYEKEYDKALSDYNEVLKIAPNYGAAYCGRGEIFELKGKYDEAIAEFDKAIKTNNQTSMVFYHRGFCYLQKRDRKKAIADFETVLKVDPNGPFSKTSVEIINELKRTEADNDLKLIAATVESTIETIGAFF